MTEKYNTILKKYESGFTVVKANDGKCSMCDTEWLLDEENTTESKLVFMGYDANLYPTPNFSTWKKGEWKQKQIDAALRRSRDFEGEVWLDDVKIR